MEEMVEKVPTAPKKINPRSHTPWYGRKYIVDPAVQLRVVLVFTLIGVCTGFSVGILAYRSLHQLNDIALLSGARPSDAFQIVMDSFLFRLVTIMSLTVLIFAGAGAILTHRIAGPIWKLQGELERVLAGEDIKAISFRDHDEFQELPKLINELIRGIRSSDQVSDLHANIFEGFLVLIKA